MNKLQTFLRNLRLKDTTRDLYFMNKIMDIVEKEAGSMGHPQIAHLYRFILNYSPINTKYQSTTTFEPDLLPCSVSFIIHKLDHNTGFSQKAVPSHTLFIPE